MQKECRTVLNLAVSFLAFHPLDNLLRLNRVLTEGRYAKILICIVNSGIRNLEISLGLSSPVVVVFLFIVRSLGGSPVL